LYREERAKRVAQAEAASRAAGGGIAGYRAARAQLRGELPKVQFAHLREGRLNQDDLDQLFRTIDEHPDLDFYGRLNARAALENAYLHGTTPQKSQIKLLQTAFGQEAAEEIKRISKLRQAGLLTLDVANVPRSLMATADLSAPFRQGLVAGARHPVLFARNFKPMIQAARSDVAEQEIMREIAERPNYSNMLQSGIKFTERGDLDKREEQFSSNLAEKIPGIGGVVRFSSRAYGTFLNRMRADMFDALVKHAAESGVNVEDRKQLKSIARLVNNATGRGDLGPIENWAPALNAVFFSPRLALSRINMLNPLWYASLTPYARKQAFRSMVQLGLAGGTVLSAGAYLGAKAGHDPRSADFAKLRVANTRAEILGGFPQYIRVGAQIGTGEIVSSTTGKTEKLGPGFGQRSVRSVLGRFAEAKLGPPASFLNDLTKGTNFEGDPVEIKTAIRDRVIPLAIQDAIELYGNTDSVPLALLGYSLSAFGIGTQTYVSKQPERVRKRHEDYASKVLDVVKKAGLAPKGAKELTPQMQQAINLRRERFEFRAKRAADDIRSKYEADALFLASKGIGTKAQAEAEARWAKEEKRDWVVRHRASDIFSPYFDQMYGDALSELRQLVRARGYDLPTLR